MMTSPPSGRRMWVVLSVAATMLGQVLSPDVTAAPPAPEVSPAMSPKASSEAPLEDAPGAPNSSAAVQSQDPAEWCRQSRLMGGALTESQKAARLQQIFSEDGRADAAWLTRVGPSVFPRLHEALIALEAPVEVRRMVIGDWCEATRGAWGGYAALDLAAVLEVLGRQPTDDAIGEYAGAVTELAWSKHLDHIGEPGKITDRSGVFQLASVVIPRARLAKRLETLGLLRKLWVEDQKTLALLEAGEVMQLSMLVERLNAQDPYGDEAADVVLRWVEAGGDRYAGPGALAQVLTALRRQGMSGAANREAFMAAAERVIKGSAPRYLGDKAWWSAATPEGLCALAEVIAPVLEGEDRAFVKGRVVSILRDGPGTPGELERPVTPLALRAAAALGVDRGEALQALYEQVARRLAGLVAAGTRTGKQQEEPVVAASPLAWGRLMEDVKSFRGVSGPRPAGSQQLEGRVSEAALALLGSRDYFTAYDAQAVLVMAERAGELTPAARNEHALSLMNRWMLDGDFVAQLSDSRVRLLIVALERLPDGQTQARRLAALWVRGSSLWTQLPPSRLAHLCAFVDPTTQEGRDARGVLFERMRVVAVDQAYLNRWSAGEVYTLYWSVVKDQETPPDAALRAAAFRRLAAEEAQLVPAFKTNLGPWRGVLEVLSESLPDAKNEQAWLVWAEGWLKESLSREPSSVGMVVATLGSYGREVWPPRVQVRVSAKDAAGDSAAAWHLAQAYVIETLPGGVSGIFSGARQINQALTLAESEPVRLVALRWLVARNLQAQYYQEAENLILGVRGQFTSEVAQAGIGSMLDRIESVRRDDAERQVRATRYTELSRLMGRLSVLQARLDKAKVDGRTAADLVRLETMVANVSNELARMRLE